MGNHLSTGAALTLLCIYLTLRSVNVVVRSVNVLVRSVNVVVRSVNVVVRSVNVVVRSVNVVVRIFINMERTGSGYRGGGGHILLILFLGLASCI